MIEIDINSEQLQKCKELYFYWLIGMFKSKGNKEKMKFLISYFNLQRDGTLNISDGQESINYLNENKEVIINKLFNFNFFKNINLFRTTQLISRRKYNQRAVSHFAYKKSKYHYNSQKFYHLFRKSDLPYKFYSEILGISTCPYCNKNTLEIYEINNKTKCRFEIDHYKPISKYPEYGLHFFNLIPSCKNCNFIKLHNEHISPYNIKNNDSYFEIDVEKMDYKDIIKLTSSSRIIVNYTGRFKDNLNLKERYNIEHRKIKMIIKKKYWYDEYYFKLLNETLDIKFSHNNISELLELDYTEKDFLTTPYSKLTYDLIKQLDSLTR